MGNVDRLGLCRGMDYPKGRPLRCMGPAGNKHMSPTGEEFFLCDRHEDIVMDALDGKSRVVNQIVLGGRRLTGVK